MSTHLTIGEPAPDFTLNDGTGAERSLSQFRGHSVIVYFYPAAFTPGCTTEACDFRDNLASLTAAGYQVVGISPDPVDKLADFAADESLTFPLLSDLGGAVADRWGAWGEQTFGDKTFTGVLRSTFVIDPNGVLVDAQYGVAARGHVAALRETLGA